MSAKRELVLRITPNERSIRVEEMKDGVTSFKEIALETFYDCVRYSIRHEGVQSGFLPQNCFHVSVSENGDRDFCLWHPHLHADISYFGTEYPDFPLPRLVFRFRVSQEGKVFDCRLGVVEDNPPAEDSAMFVYPFLYSHGFLDMSEKAYGMFVGGTLHEVAHAVAAGQAISIDAGNTAVIVKMLRVIMIAPLLICLGFWLNRFPEKTEEESRVPSYGTYNFSSFPWFAVLFIACIGINSLGIIPKQAVSVINSLDIFMLTMAMCALGMETSLEKVRMVGPKPFLLAGVLALWLIGGGYFVTRFILSLNF